MTLFSDNLNFCKGYLHAKVNEAPRSAYRIERSDGVIVEQHPAKDGVSIGMIAGYPTAEQYERAAANALDKAAIIRANQNRTRPKYQLNRDGSATLQGPQMEGP